MKIVSITLACVAMSGLADIVFGYAPVHAHDWYPIECCARNDCMPAIGIEEDRRGGMTVIVGDLRVAIPKGFASRQSPDSRVHVCFRAHTDHTDGSVTLTPVCLFLPAQV